MKILISWAWIAWLTCAYRLQKFGFEPIVVEKAKELRDEWYMIDFLWEWLQISEAMWIFPALQKKCEQFKWLNVLNDSWKKVWGFSIKDTQDYMATKWHKFISISRGDLERELYNALQNKKAIRFDDYITSLEEHSDWVHITFDSGKNDVFDIVIWADGIHSSTREFVRWNEQQFLYWMDSKVLITRLWGVWKLKDYEWYAKSHLAPWKMMITIPTINEDLLVICWINTKEKLWDIRKNSHKFIEENYSQYSLGKEVCDWLKDDTFVFVDDIAQVHMKQRYKWRTILIWDAASCPTLLSGQWAHLAMTQAYVLAHQLSLHKDSYIKAFEWHNEALFELVKERMKRAKKLQWTVIPKNWFMTKVSYIIFLLMKYKRMISLSFAPFAKPSLFDEWYPLEIQ